MTLSEMRGNMGKDKVVKKAPVPLYEEPEGLACIEFLSIVLAPYQGIAAGDLQHMLESIWRACRSDKVKYLKVARWYAVHLTVLVREQREDIDVISRIWRTATVKPTPKEQATVELFLKKEESRFSSEEVKRVHLIMNSIYEGNIYRLKQAAGSIVIVLDEWIAEADYCERIS